MSDCTLTLILPSACYYLPMRPYCFAAALALAIGCAFEEARYSCSVAEVELPA